MNDETHPLASVIEVLRLLIEKYEDEQVPAHAIAPLGCISTERIAHQNHQRDTRGRSPIFDFAVLRAGYRRNIFPSGRLVAGDNECDRSGGGQIFIVMRTMRILPRAVHHSTPTNF